MDNSFESSNSATIEELLKVAREDLSRSSLTSAERALEQAILMNNQVADSFHLLGLVYSKKGKFKKAILALERALALDPFHTDAAIALSSLYNDTGRYKEGAAVFQKTKKRLERTAPGHDPKINQKLAAKHGELAKEYMRYERFSEAYEEFTKAIKLDSERFEDLIQMAKCLSRLGDYEGAIGVLQKGLAKDPKNVDIRIQMGILYHSQQKLKEAYQEWQAALTLDPDNKSAQMYLSMLDPNVGPNVGMESQGVRGHRPTL